MDLHTIISEIKAKLDQINVDREDILKISRDMIRNCSIAIKSVHRKEFDEYLEKIKEIESNHKDLLQFVKKNQILFSKYLKTPEQEYVEAVCLYSIIKNETIPSPKDLGVDDINYLLGVADVIGELRRYVLDQMRRDETESLDEVLNEMENLYTYLFSLDYPKSLTQDLRHKTDVARSIIEKTRGDISITLQINKLNKNLEKK